MPSSRISAKSRIRPSTMIPFAPLALMRAVINPPQAAFTVSKYRISGLLRCDNLENFMLYNLLGGAETNTTLPGGAASAYKINTLFHNFWDQKKNKFFTDELTKCCFGFGEIVSVRSTVYYI